MCVHGRLCLGRGFLKLSCHPIPSFSREDYGLGLGSPQLCPRRNISCEIVERIRQSCLYCCITCIEMRNYRWWTILAIKCYKDNCLCVQHSAGLVFIKYSWVCMCAPYCSLYYDRFLSGRCVSSFGECAASVFSRLVTKCSSLFKLLCSFLICCLAVM